MDVLSAVRYVGQGPGVLTQAQAGGALVTRALGVADLPAYSSVPAARVYQGTAQSLAANAWTPLDWTATSYDPLGLADLSANTLTVPQAGLYLVAGGVVVAQAGQGARVAVGVWDITGELARLADAYAVVAGGDLAVYGTAPLVLAANTALRLQCYLQDTAARQTYPGAPYVWWTVTLLWRG